MSGMTNLDYSNMFRFILSHHQANIRMKQSGCPHIYIYNYLMGSHYVIYYHINCMSKPVITIYTFDYDNSTKHSSYVKYHI
jgi:hypothetical protein